MNIGDYIPQSAEITLTAEQYATFIFVAKEHERERIIKLLQETRESRPCQCDECGDHVWGKAIDLIKGEQN